MATAEAIVLSSSPPASFIATTPPCHGQFAPPSSSPGFPSPSAIMRKKDPSNGNGTRISAFSEGALRGFTTASSLLRESSEKGGTVLYPSNKRISRNGLEKDEEKKLEPQPENDGGISKPVSAIETKKPAAPRRKYTKKSESEKLPGQDGHHAIQTGKGCSIKKPRVKKVQAVGQTKITKGKIVKSVQRGATTEDVQSGNLVEFGKGVLDDNPKTQEDMHTAISMYEGDDSLGLDKVVARRRDWTPTIANSHRPTELNGEGILEKTVQDPEFSPNDHTRPFIRDSSGGGLTKKRKLDLIEPVIPQRLPKLPSKYSDSAKKRPQTVTAKATENFISKNTMENSPLRQYLSPSQIPRESTGDQPETAPAQQPVKRTRRKPEAKKASKSNTGKASLRKSTLLSPEEALQSTTRQDLLFGTSSQLAREESPTFVRDIQKAIKASEAEQETKTTALTGFDDTRTSTSSAASGVFLFTSSRNLWSVAARDDDGRLLKTEVVNLIDTPKPRSMQNADLEDNVILDPPLDSKGAINQEVGDTTDYFGTPKITLAPVKLPIAADAAEAEDQFTTHQPIPKSVAEAALRQRPKSRSPIKKAVSSTTHELPVAAAAAAADAMPDFQGYTTAKLSKAIASYGFKPVKNRDTMIGLLEKCWEGKTRLALQSLPTNVSLPQPTETNNTSEKPSSPVKRRRRPPKKKDPPTGIEGGTSIQKPAPKPRGRPKKGTIPPTANASPEKQPAAPIQPALPKPKTPTKPTFKTPRLFIPLDDIEDPTAPATPSPPRQRRSPSTSSKIPSLPLTTNPPSLVCNSPSTSSSHTHLHAKITEAITSFPPTHDVQNLTWNEKILMYDPIVLEDLAAWLNTVGLGTVGVDEEVSALEVRGWCEKNSVCCLWKENLRGEKRKRW